MRVMAIRLLVYVLFVLGGACICLAILVLFGGVAIWFGLKSGGGFKLAGELAAGGIVSILLGLLVHWLLNRHLAREAPPPSLPLENKLDSEPRTP
jgi:hypothetical protein